jgi:hypothetical protein
MQGSSAGSRHRRRGGGGAAGFGRLREEGRRAGTEGSKGGEQAYDD